MTPRELMRQADQRKASAALAADIAELGPPSGWIVVNARPMAFWLPEGVHAADLGLDEDEAADDASGFDDAAAPVAGQATEGATAPVAKWATDGATKDEVPF